ncbi:hypothetical protein GCM10009093_12210 [Brevundimonas terrae]|uniref:Uncharacterized protein n=1 Tax=Brevundimonas terrae TaxID=363631 RepID=A0ABN0Y8F1_9CAUL
MLNRTDNKATARARCPKRSSEHRNVVRLSGSTREDDFIGPRPPCVRNCRPGKLYAAPGSPTQTMVI